MRKDLFRLNNPNSHLTTAFRINLGIGLMMGIIAFGGMLGPSYPLQADPTSQQKRTLTMTGANEPLPEIGLSSNEVVYLREKTRQQDAKITQLNKEILTLHTKIQELNRTLFAKDNALDNSKLKTLNDKLQQKNRFLAKQDKQIARLETELAEIKAKEDHSKVTIDSLSEMIAILKDSKDKMYAQHLDELQQMQLLTNKEKSKLLKKIAAFQGENEKLKSSHQQKVIELTKALEDHSLSQKDWEANHSKLHHELADLRAELEAERVKKKLLMDELDTWNSYSEELKQDMANLNLTYSDIQNTLLVAGYNAAEMNDTAEINHVLQTYQIENNFTDVHQDNARLKGHNNALKATLDATIAQHQSDLEALQSLQNNIQALQAQLASAQATFSQDAVLDVAREGAEKEYETQVESLVGAIREQEFAHKYQQEQAARKALEENLTNLAAQTEDREREIANWVAEWEQKVVLAKEEADQTKLELNLEIVSLMLQKTEAEKKLNDYLAQNNSNDEVIRKLENERDNALQNLAFLEERQADLLKQVDELTQKHSQVVTEFKQHTNEAGSAESTLAVEIQALEETVNKLRTELAQEKEYSVAQGRDSEAKQMELAALYEEAKKNIQSLEDELNNARTQHLETRNNTEFFAVQVQELEELTQLLRKELLQEQMSFKDHKEASETKQAELALLYEQAQSDLQSLENQLLASKAHHHDEIQLTSEGLATQIQELEELTQKLKMELAQEKDGFHQYRQNAESKNTELAQLYEEAQKQSTHQHNEYSTLIQNLETERENALKNVSEAEERQGLLLKQIEELNQKYTALEKENASQQFLQKIQDLEETTMALQDELTQERNNFAAQRANIEKQEADIASLSQAIHNMERERDDALRKVASSEEHQKEILAQLDDLMSKYSDVEKELQNKSAHASQASQDFQNQLQALEAKAKQFEEELKQERTLSAAHHEDLTAAIAVLEEERDTALQKHQNSHADRESLLSSIDQLRNKVMTLEDALTKQTTETQDVIQHLEKQLEETREDLDEMHNNLQSSHEELSSKEQNYVEKEQNYKDKIHSLEKELTDMQQFIDEEKSHWNTFKEELPKD